MAPIDAFRRGEADTRLQELSASIAGRTTTETLVVNGDPADEIAKLAGIRQANLIVMGLHSSEPLGPRMGSVTYRVLATTHELVLAVPPAVNVAAP